MAHALERLRSYCTQSTQEHDTAAPTIQVRWRPSYVLGFGVTESMKPHQPKTGGSTDGTHNNICATERPPVKNREESTTPDRYARLLFVALLALLLVATMIFAVSTWGSVA